MKESNDPVLALLLIASDQIKKHTNNPDLAPTRPIEQIQQNTKQPIKSPQAVHKHYIYLHKQKKKT